MADIQIKQEQLLQERIPLLLEHIKKHSKNIEHNEKIFDILEGNLLDQVLESLRKQLSGKAFIIAEQRVAPINILKKIIMKLSKLYTLAPVRKVIDGGTSDQDLVDDYSKSLGLDSYMVDKNEAFNSYKWTSQEIYEDPKLKQLQTRIIPSHQFLPYSDDPVNPLRMTVLIKFMGTFDKVDPKSGGRKNKFKTVDKFWAYSPTEFIAFDSDGDLIQEDMVMNEGDNIFGIIPFVYTSRSRYLLIPKVDSDTIRMTTLVPILLTDLNFAAQFMSHAVIYGIDVDSENLELNPNAFWNLKSDSSGKKPEIGVIRPDVDIAGVLNLIHSEVSAWLESRNIKPGAAGKLTEQNAASGVSMMLREMDTTQDRKIQEKFFIVCERELWKKIAQMHNILAKAGRIDDRRVFSDPENLEVLVQFADQKPIEDRKDKVDRLSVEIDAGLISRKAAIRELNPGLDDHEIDLIIEEINGESSIVITKGNSSDGRNQQETNGTNGTNPGKEADSKTKDESAGKSKKGKEIGVSEKKI